MALFDPPTNKSIPDHDVPQQHEDFSVQSRGFRDRRRGSSDTDSNAFERRQFGNTHFGLSPDAVELARAIDIYKMKNRRRFITCEEMLKVIHSLGYAKPETVVETSASE